MLKYLTTHFNFVVYFFEVLAILTAIFTFKKFKNTKTKLFIYYLFYVGFVELGAAAITYFKSNILIEFLLKTGIKVIGWFNIFWLIGSVIFISIYYLNILKIRLFKLILTWLSISFTITSISYLLFNLSDLNTAHPYLYIFFGAVVIFTSCVLYFLELLQLDNLIKLTDHFPFYASIALFLWWLVTSPLFFYEIYNNESDWDFVNLKRRVFLFANIFMYTCFAIGLILSKPQPKNG